MQLGQILLQEKKTGSLQGKGVHPAVMHPLQEASGPLLLEMKTELLSLRST